MRLNVTADQLAYLLDGEIRGQTRQITGISFDSRTTAPGDVFIALTSELVDGHDFVEQAFERGAVAALVERWVSASGTVIELDLNFDRAWSSVSKAMDASNIDTNDRDRSNGIFYVSYSNEEDSGFLSFLNFITF